MSLRVNLGPIISDGDLERVFLNDSKNLRVGHINAHSLAPSDRSSKLDELQFILRNKPLDIFCVTESWFDPVMPNNALRVPGYVLCRSDRPTRCKGGGVAIYISEGIRFKVVHRCTEYFSCEALFIEVYLETVTLLVGVTYLPTGKLKLVERFLSDIFVRYGNIIVVGDFNNNVFNPTIARGLRNICTRFGLECKHNSIPTHYDSYYRSTSLIDYFLISQNLLVSSSAQFQIPSFSHHSLICLAFRIPVCSIINSDFYRDYNHINIVALEEHIIRTDFSQIYNTGDVNLQLDFLNSLFIDLLNYVPLRKVRQDKKVSVAKFSNEINYNRSLRDIALKTYFDNRNDENWENYRQLRNQTKHMIREWRKNHYVRLFNGSDTRKMWKVLRSAGALGDSCDHADIDVDLVNEAFIGNQLDSVDDLDFCGFANSPNAFSFSNITMVELEQALLQVKSSSVGIDGISIKFLVKVFPYVSGHLLHFVNNILTTSVFPREWKVARILPIPKHGTELSLDNMRPISILPSLSKVVEYTIKNQVMRFIDDRKLLHDCQYGFRQGRSTNLLLMGLTETVRKCLNEREVSVLVSIDISKAFDQLKHSLLVKKLNVNFNFSRSACRLIWSYLSNRKQYVSLNGRSSCVLNIKSGVPQGSVVGPILFCVFLNDLVDILSYSRCKPFLFADDIQLLWSGERQFMDALEASINYDLSVLNNWMVENSLSINPSKTKALIFKSSRSDIFHLNLNICNNIIETVSNLRCLGVLIDDRLSFESHINNLISRVTFTLRRLYRLNMWLPLSVKQSIAHALLMSQVNYCIEVFSGCSETSKKRIKYVIHKIVRFVYGLRLRAHVSSHLRDFLNLTFDDYLKFRLLIYLYKIVFFREPESVFRLISFLHSQRNPQIEYALISYAVYENSFAIRAGRLWNNLPRNLRSFQFSVESFKRRLREYFTSYYS